MSVRAKIDPAQEELPLSSLRPDKDFEGRMTLYVKDVAAYLNSNEPHIINLILKWHETKGAQGLEGFSIDKNWQPGMPSARGCWRIPLAGMRAFIASRTTTHIV